MNFTLKITKKANLFVFILGACLFSTQIAFSQVTWKTGATTTEWSDAANWSTGAVPTASDSVVIIEGANVRVTTMATCRKLNINGSTGKQGKLTIESGGTLTVSAIVAATSVGGVGRAAVLLYGGIIDNNGIMTVAGRQNLDGIRFDNPISGAVNSTYTGTGVLNCNTSNSSNGGGNSISGSCITFAQASGTATFTVGGTYNLTTGATVSQGTPAFPTSKSAFYCADGNAVINGAGSISIGGDKRAIRVVSVLGGAANLTIESGVILQLASIMNNGNSGIVTCEINQADANSKLTNRGTLNFSGAKGNPIGLLSGVNATNVAAFINEGTININGDFTDATLNVTLGGIFFGGVNVLQGSSFTNATTGKINYNTINTGTSVKPLFFSSNSAPPKFTITNNGTITIGTNGALTNAIKLGDLNTVFNNAGTLTVGVGNIVNTRGTGTNALFNNNVGGVLNFPSAVASAITDSVTFTNAGGTLRGSGTFNNLGGNVFNAASVISPGQAAGAGIFTFGDAALTLNGTFNANVNGKATAGTDFDRINAPSAAVNVAGLTIAATIGYTPVNGDMVVLIDAASITGRPTFTLPTGWAGTVTGGQVRISFSGSVGVKETLKDLVSISPNPTSDKVNVNWGQNEVSYSKATLTLFDMTGRQVLTQTSTAGAYQLDLSNLAKGMYMLTVQSENAVYQEKIIRQ